MISLIYLFRKFIEGEVGSSFFVQAQTEDRYKKLFIAIRMKRITCVNEKLYSITQHRDSSGKQDYKEIGCTP